MPQLSADDQRTMAEIAERHRVSPDAVLTLVAALQAGGGRQAQFSHSELGGMGQWSLGGMVMISDMFNSGLRARVSSLCEELSVWLSRIQSQPSKPRRVQSQSQSHRSVSYSSANGLPSWWPSELGSPTSAGAQNGLSYAHFSGARCLAINDHGQITVYNTGEHQISGVSQQQGGGESVTFTSQLGYVRLADLPLVEFRGKNREPEPSGTEPSRRPQDALSVSIGVALTPEETDPGSTAGDDIIATIERLAELRGKGVLTEEEFSAKKAELLSRL